MDRPSLLRLMDANANRALEGARVCEDLGRLALSSPAAFRRLRAIRHGIAAAMRRLPVSRLELVSARASGTDPGRRARPGAVAGAEQLLLINFQRVKEALRVLEECSRAAAPRSTAAFQRLRFQTYDAERELLLRLDAVRHRRPRRGRRT
jgi:thiamine-phosphate pyrophosphorylase